MHENHSSLLNIIPWYQDKNLIFYREIVVDKRVHITAFGWPVSIICPDANGIKFSDVSAGQLLHYFKVKGNKDEQYRLEVKPDGIGIEVKNLRDFYLRTKDQAQYTWGEIRDFIAWKNRFAATDADSLAGNVPGVRTHGNQVRSY